VPCDCAHLFATHAQRLCDDVQRIVRTSRENVEDACSFAFLQLLCCRPNRDSAYAWLVKVAVCEAIKLDCCSRRELPLEQGDCGRDITWEPADRTDVLALRLDIIAAREAILAARLSPRQARIVALQALGLDYEEIGSSIGCTTRTVESQIVRARRKLREARRSAGG
jgi:DNA-directed RNA polymerase specialized sigma24 family protein